MLLPKNLKNKCATKNDIETEPPRLSRTEKLYVQDYINSTECFLECIPMTVKMSYSAYTIDTALQPLS